MRIIRRPILVFGAVLAAVALTACSTGPRQQGAAAIVGDTVVPLAQIQQDLNALISAHPTEAAQAQQHKQLGQVSRQLLGTQIRHLLLAQQRKTDHLGYSHAQFDQLLRSYQQQNNGGKPLSGVEEQQARTAITDQLLQVDLAKKKLAGLSLDADVVLADSRADALAKSKQIAAHPGSVTTLIRQSSGASNHYTGVELAQSTNQLSLLPMLSAPNDSVVAFPVQVPTQQQSASPRWVVCYVHNLKHGKAAPGESAALGQINPQILDQSGQALLAIPASAQRIKVNPRYGVFDPVAVDVAASASATAGLELPLHRS